MNSQLISFYKIDIEKKNKPNVINSSSIKIDNISRFESIHKSHWNNEISTESVTELSENYGKVINDYYDKMSDNNENWSSKF